MNLRSFIQRAGQWGFQQLYHAWARSYDTVAAIVSLGRWYDWVSAIQPFLTWSACAGDWPRDRSPSRATGKQPGSPADGSG